MSISNNTGGPGTSDKPLYILCFDGGGVRGLSSLVILRDPLEQLPADPRTHKPPRPCEIFDIICGTSTGGIIALMLGRLGMNIEDTIKSYQSFSETVFGKKKIMGSAKYDASKLQKWMEKLVAEKTKGAVSHTFANAPPKLFRTYADARGSKDKCTIWEAARATTAAVPFFEPATVGSPPQEYVDGYFSGSNNPSQLAIQEAGDLFPSRKIGCLLSVGTGDPSNISIPMFHGAIEKACMELLKSCERVHEETHTHFKQNMGGEGYTRLSVPKGFETIKLDEWKREKELTGTTDAYLRHGEVKDKVDRCVEKLKERDEEVLAARLRALRAPSGDLLGRQQTAEGGRREFKSNPWYPA